MEFTLAPNQILATAGNFKTGQPFVFAIMATNVMANGTQHPLIKRALITAHSMYTLLRPSWEQYMPIAMNEDIRDFRPTSDAIPESLFADIITLMSQDAKFGPKPAKHGGVVFPWYQLDQGPLPRSRSVEAIMQFDHKKIPPSTQVSVASGFTVQTIDALAPTVVRPSAKTITFLDL